MSSVWEVFANIVNVFSLIAMILSCLAWLNARRVLKKMRLKEKLDEQRITILLTSKYFDAPLQLPAKIRRKNLRRSEIQGLLGILPMQTKGERYQIDYLNTEEFYAELEAIEAQEEKIKLSIKLEESELAQFDIPRLKAQCATRSSEVK